MADNQSIYEVLIKFGMDAKVLQAAAKELNNLDKSAKNSSSSLDGMGKGLKAALQAGMQLAGIGGIIATISKATQAYNAQVGTTEKTSRAWIEATQEIEAAWVNVGRQIEQAVLPQFQALAKLMNTMSKGVTFQSGADASANFLNSFFGMKPNTGDNPLSHLFDNLKVGANNYPGTAIGQTSRTNGSTDVGASAPKSEAVNGGPWNNVDFVKQMYQYNQQSLQIERAANIQRSKMQRDFNLSQRYAEEDFNKSRTRQTRDFNLSILHQDQDFARQRMLSQRDFGIQMVRNEQDFQLQRKRAAEDHQFDMFQIALSGDAMSYYLAQRSFNISEQRATEDYNRQRARSQEDQQRSLDDQQTDFNIQRSRTLQEYQIQRQDQQQDYDISRSRALAAYKLSLTDMEISLKEQRMQREQAMRDELMLSTTNADNLIKLRSQIGQTEVQIMDQVYNSALQYYNAYKDMPNPYGGPNGSHEVGGYTQPGLSELHGGEYVLTRATTNAAEQAAKHKNLSQQDLVQLFTGGGGKGLTYNDQRRFETAVSAEDRAAILDDTRTLLIELMGA